MTPTVALRNADLIVQNAGYVSMSPTNQNFTEYSKFVIDIIKSWSHKQKNSTPWLMEFLETWKFLQDNYAEEVARDPAMAYRPQHDVALAFHKSQAQTKFACMANRTSKTQMAVIEDYWIATGQHPYRVNNSPSLPSVVCVLAGTPLKEYSQKVFNKKFLEGEAGNKTLSPLFPENGKWFNHHDKKNHIITLACPECAESGKAQACPSWHQKSQIMLFSGEQGVEVLEGFQAGLMHLDEHVEEKFYQAAKMRIMSVKYSYMMVTATPLFGPEAWEQQLLAKRAEGPAEDNLYDPTDPDSPPAVELFRICQFKAGITPHAKIRDAMANMDYFEQQVRIYGFPAALAKSPIFDRSELTRVLEMCREPVMGHLIISDKEEEQTIESICYSRDVEFIPSTSLRAHPRFDGDKNDPFSGIRLWEEPQSGVDYVIGADVSAGVSGGDRSSACVLKITHKEGKMYFSRVAEWYGLINVVDYGDELKKLGTWYNSAMLAVERTGLGLATVERLRRQIGYDNLFRDMNKPDQFRHDLGSTFGLDTNTASKPKLVGMGQKAIKDGLVELYCSNTIAELTAYEQIRTDSGLTTRYEGASGSRDDRVMSLLIALYVATIQPDQFDVQNTYQNPSAMDKEQERRYNIVTQLNEAMDKWKL